VRCKVEPVHRKETMSNWKRAYGWSGHILTAIPEDVSPENNVVLVQAEAFEALVNDFENGSLDTRIGCEQLGIASEPVCFLAAGTGFSDGFSFYGTIFTEAEARVEGKVSVDLDAEYLVAMKEIYGIELPPCRLMIGCSCEQ